MSSPARQKYRYRHDPEFRAAVLEANRRSRERDPNPNRTRLNRLASEICRLRDSVKFHMQALDHADKRLVELVLERERLKAAAPKRATGRRAA